MGEVLSFINALLPGMTIGTIIGAVVTREILRVRFEKAVKNGDIIIKETKESEGAMNPN